MDDIYDDLENYNDVNVLAELINENKELKVKLEEYKFAFEKLQKNILQEFDKVSTERKKIETNFSSLLKTAKAEIERKTQAIVSINQEKDVLVLNTIQKTKQSLVVLRRHMVQERANNRKSRRDETECKKDVQDGKKHEPDRMRNDENRLPSVDTTSSGDTNDSNIIKIENKSTKLDVYDKTGGSKENVAKGKKALSLKQRRKSMPILNKQQVKCSSDEEFEDDGSDDIKKERFSREEKSRKYFDRYKISETSGIDEKYSSYHESSRETYYKGKSHRPMDKFKSIRDKPRFRKHFSPEKVRRPTRDYREEERQELFRHNRVLVSPPRERVNPLRMLRDRRSNYERDRSLEERHSLRDDLDDRMRKEDFHEDRLKQREDYRQGRHQQKYGFYEERQRSRTRSNERYRQRGSSHEERLRQKSEGLEEKHKSRDNSLVSRHKQNYEASERHKDEIREEKQTKICSNATVKQERKSRRRERQSDNDEPSSKRARTDSCKTIDEVVKCREEPHIAQEKLLPEFAQHLQYTSCQSPESSGSPHHDTQPLVIPTIAQTKEIMTTSSCYVEDPRLISKKYVQSVLGDKIVLETVTGRNVDMVPVDISKWDTQQEKAPSLQKPPEFSDEMVQEVYTNIDNPILDTSLELGEIESESNDGGMADYLTKNFYQDYENERIKQIEARADKEIASHKHKRDTRINQDQHTKGFVDSEQNKKLASEPKLPPVRYKLPRPSNPEPKPDPAPDPLGLLFKQLTSVCDVNPATKPPGAKLDVDATFGTDDESQDKSGKNEVIKPAEMRQLRGRTISAQELVEGDLALSDETCDNVFMQRQKRKQKLKEKANTVCKTQKTESVLDIEQKTAKPVAKLKEKKQKKSKTDVKVNDQKVECKTNETEPPIEDKILKKTRKKPSSKQKTTSAKESAKTVDVEKITDKKTKGKKSKSPKDTKDFNQGNKFTELFGDSSSLMTPEDLGMVTQAQTEGIQKYVPIFEDAQDAVDVNVIAMKKKEIQTIQPPVTSSKIDEPTTVIEQAPKSLVCKLNLPNKSVSKIDKAKNDTIAVAVKKVTPNMEISNEEVTKELDIVKTVIISTGVQPKMEDIKMNINLPNKNANITKTTDSEVHEPAIPIALATSTPHKKLLLQLEAQIECNSSCSSNEVPKDITPADQSSASNGLTIATPNDDVPDVRIFMKRRRRLKK